MGITTQQVDPECEVCQYQLDRRRRERDKHTQTQDLAPRTTLLQSYSHQVVIQQCNTHTLSMETEGFTSFTNQTFSGCT